MSRSVNDETLLPPSAFEITDMNSSNTIHKFDSYKVFPCEKFCLDNYCQTENIRKRESSTSPIYEIFELYEVKERIEEEKLKYSQSLENDLIGYQTERCELLRVQRQLSRELDDYKFENKKLIEDLDKMKFYISGVSNREEWFKEKQILICKIEILEQNEQELISTIESQKSQQINLETILEMQEQELGKSLRQELPHKYHNRKEQQVDNLLNRWRQEVLKLLVQKQSDQLVYNSDKQKLKNQLRTVEDKLIELNDLNETLSLKLENAQIQLKNNNKQNEKLNNDLSMMSEELFDKSNQLANQHELVLQLSESMWEFEKVMGGPIWDQLQGIRGRITMLDNRIEFAQSRLPLIRTIMMRKQLNHRQEQHTPEVLPDNPSLVQQLQESLAILQKELCVVKCERDKLCEALEEDSKTFAWRLQQKKDELDDEMKTLKSRLANLETSYNTVKSENAVLSLDNARLKDHAQQMMNDKMSSSEQAQQQLSSNRNQITELELQLSQTRRQLHSSQQIIERMKSETESRLDELNDQWQHKLRSLTEECEMLKMTITQQDIFTQLNQQLDIDQPAQHETDCDASSLMKQIEDLTKDLQN